MWLYEVHDAPRRGFRVSLRPGQAVVPMGIDEETKCQAVLPIGKSIMRHLDYSADSGKSITLLRARLDYTTAGLMLVRQDERDAIAERRALVLFDENHDPASGITRVESSMLHSQPQLITWTKGDSCVRSLYLFRPGDGLFVCWSATDDGTPGRPKRFIVHWNGSELVETPCQRQRPKRRRRRRSFAREHRQELAPEA